MLIHTDLRTMGQDLQELRPTFIPAVPRVWEKHNRMQLVMRKTGKEKAFHKHETRPQILQHKDNSVKPGPCTLPAFCFQ